jgi:hypothetical protein
MQIGVKSVLAVCFWVAVCIAALFYLSKAQITEFDPKLQLALASMEKDFDARFTRILDVGDSATVVHLTGNNCACETLTKRHADQLAKRLENDQYSAITVNINEHPKLAAYIPSTPAVAILGEGGELRYLGPYAAGLGCVTNVTFIDRLTKLAQQRNFQGAIINHEIEGCFCHTNHSSST